MERKLRLRSRAGAAAVVMALTIAGCTATSNPDGSPSPSPRSQESAPPDEGALLREMVPGLHTDEGPFEQVDSSVNKPAGQDIAISVDASAEPVGQWQSTNVGLSFELRELADPRWEPGASSLEMLIGELDGAALRFGGNSADRNVWFTDSNEPPQTGHGPH